MSKDGIADRCRQEEPGAGRPAESIAHPYRDQAQIRRVFLQTIDDIDTSGATDPIVTAGGREIEAEWSNRTVRDEQGRATGVVRVGRERE